MECEQEWRFLFLFSSFSSLALSSSCPAPTSFAVGDSVPKCQYNTWKCIGFLVLLSQETLQPVHAHLAPLVVEVCNLFNVSANIYIYRLCAALSWRVCNKVKGVSPGRYWGVIISDY